MASEEVSYTVHLKRDGAMVHITARTEHIPSKGTYAVMHSCVSGVALSAALMGDDWAIGVECDRIERRLRDFVERPLHLVNTIDEMTAVSGGR
jgi:hypothetical protein